MQQSELVIYPSNRKMLGLGLVSLIFCALGAFFLWGIEEEGSSQLYFNVIGIVVLVFFGLCFIYLLSRLFVKKPAIIIREDGLFENASYVGAGLIPWEEIREVYIYEYMGQKMLGIETKDPDFALKKTKLNGFKKLLMKANKGLVKAQISIPQTTISVPLEELEESIKRYIQA
ncbi:STM3941 family protein [Rubeoparvulum massiliense]|uniref:STM3941 family protein n=1 Tax=Rubeoparvulum massiliense TaxID=1631346 RepID=UPI00065DE749|nr:STM3941 family protein [Rubeoparvulum massiliense]